MIIKKYDIDKKAKLINYWQEHWYLVDDVYLPSVTSVLGMTLSKGAGFEQWLRDTGNESKIIARESAESGSKIHNAIEMLCLGNELNGEEYTVFEWEKIINFVNWFNELNVEVIANETTVYSLTDRVAGTADFIGVINGEIWLLDWKTGKSIHESANMQVASYVKYWNANNKIKIQRAGVVHIGASTKTQKDLNNVGVKLTEIDIDREYDNFKHVLSLYNSLYPNRKAPNTTYPLTIKLKKGVKNET